MGAAYRTLDALESIAGQCVIMRADLNMPMDQGRITDLTRLDRVMPSIRDLIARGARVVVLSHLGRPKRVEADLSLAPMAARLGAALGQSVTFCPEVSGSGYEHAVRALPAGQVLLVENTRFDPREEANEPSLAEDWAKVGDIYVNDAFSCAHRAHASTEGLAHLLPAYAGRAMQTEIDILERVLGAPKRPLVAIVGGSKVSTKIDLLTNLVGKVDVLIIGGGMANTFLAAHGNAVGKSLCEADLGVTVRAIEQAALRSGCRILLPIDAVIAKEFKAHADARTVAIDQVSDDAMILDVGSASLASFATAIEGASSVVWNGPLGAFEVPPFDGATMSLARHVAMLTRAGRIIAIAGGGDTVAALNQAGVANDLTYVSTAGGAFLEWLEGKTLPGVAALTARRDDI